MASVFLSYDREDAAKARPIAAALERAGHSVWWDRHIRGGAQYAKEIEQALKAADAVVVLWSARSVDSAWVRDEAAAGRDSGRLVPLSLDGVEPPLGFRQFHSIDFTGWKGRPRSAEFQQLLHAVDGQAGASPAAPPAVVDQPRRLRVPAQVVAALLVVAALIGLAATAWLLTGRGSDVATVAVAAADNSAASREIARDLLVKLGSLETANPNSMDLIGQSPGGSADLTFEVAGSTDGQQSAANLVLLHGEDRSVLWSREFRQPRDRQADLRQQLGYSAARVLDCALEGLAAQIERPTLKLYLTGCAEFAESAFASLEDLIPLFREVTANAPGFEGGWSKLLLVEAATVFRLGEATDPSLRRELRQHIAAARNLDPDMAQAFVAEATLVPNHELAQRMRLLDEAVEHDPQDSFARARRSIELLGTGRLRDAVRDAQRAAELDPLSPFTRAALINVLMIAGRMEAAVTELERAERLWPGASNMLVARYRTHLRFGDPAEALRLLRSGAAGPEGNPVHEPFLQARLDPSPATIDRAIDSARAAMRAEPAAIVEYVEALGAFGRNQELFDTLLKAAPDPSLARILFRPAFRDFWRDPRSLLAARQLALLHYWRTSGKWPDFCFEPDLPYDCKAEAASLAKTTLSSRSS